MPNEKTKPADLPVTNISSLRRVLCECIAEVRADRANIPQAEAVSNAAGKIINAVRARLEYHKMRREKPPADPFMA